MNGISNLVRFNNKSVSWENLGQILSGLGLYSGTGPEENRVESAIIMGNSIGYPLVRIIVHYKSGGPGHGDTGIFVSDHTYQLLKNKYGNEMIDWKTYGIPYITNGWVWNRELATQELSDYIILYILPKCITIKP